MTETPAYSLSPQDKWPKPTRIVDLFVVVATVGEYSDRREWVVAAYTDEQLAKDHCELAKQWPMCFPPPDKYDEHEKYKQYVKDHPYDPGFSTDYIDTTSYFVQKAPLNDFLEKH